MWRWQRLWFKSSGSVKTFWTTSHLVSTSLHHQIFSWLGEIRSSWSSCNHVYVIHSRLLYISSICLEVIHSARWREKLTILWQWRRLTGRKNRNFLAQVLSLFRRPRAMPNGALCVWYLYISSYNSICYANLLHFIYIFIGEKIQMSSIFIYWFITVIVV